MQGLDGLDFNHQNLFQQQSRLHYMRQKHLESQNLQPDAMEEFSDMEVVGWLYLTYISVTPNVESLRPANYYFE